MLVTTHNSMAPTVQTKNTFKNPSTTARAKPALIQPITRRYFRTVGSSRPTRYRGFGLLHQDLQRWGPQIMVHTAPNLLEARRRRELDTCTFHLAASAVSQLPTLTHWPLWRHLDFRHYPALR